MSDDPSPSWDGFGDSWKGNLAAKLRHYEEKAVKHVCVAVSVDWRALLDISRERDGTPSVTFALLNEQGDIPVQFGVGKLIYLHTLDVADLFKRFHKTAVITSFLELAEGLDGRQAMGMIFQWPRVSQFMCVHTFPSSPPRARRKADGKLPPPDVRVSAEVRWKAGRRLNVTLEPLDTLLRCFQ